MVRCIISYFPPTLVFPAHQSLLKMLSNPLADPNETRQVASTGPCPQSALYQDLLVMAYRGSAKAEIGKEDKMMYSVQEPQTSSFVFLDAAKQPKQTSSELNGDFGINTNFEAGTDKGNGWTSIFTGCIYTPMSIRVISILKVINILYSF